MRSDVRLAGVLPDWRHTPSCPANAGNILSNNFYPANFIEIHADAQAPIPKDRI
jgi:hypothetical protein